MPTDRVLEWLAGCHQPETFDDFTAKELLKAREIATRLLDRHE